jgi:dTDP-glucose 4,6-dehydratase
MSENTVFKNILVTGCCGFIGSNFVNYILSKYDDIFILNIDRLDYCANENNIEEKYRKSDRYRLVVADINNKEFILRCLSNYNIDTIIHFAAQSHVDNSFGNSIHFTVDNVLGTHTLLECAKVYNKLTRFLHFSTDEVYGSVNMDEEGCDEEVSLLNPSNMYSASKAAAEFMVKSYYHSFKIPIIITRCNNVYGPYQYTEKLIPRFISKLLENEKCEIHGNGESRRNFIYADDVSSAVEVILQKGETNKIYNIGSEDEYSVMDILHILLKKLNIEKSIEEVSIHVEDRPFQDFRYSVKTHKLEKLGWRKLIDFDDGINRTIEWYKNKKNNNN